MQTTRFSGVLLHPTSFPGPDGIGDLGPEAYRWIDFLKGSGCQMWQILPLGPTGYGDSPYQCFSAFAGNPFLVSPLLLLEAAYCHWMTSGTAQSSRLNASTLAPRSFGRTPFWTGHT